MQDLFFLVCGVIVIYVYSQLIRERVVVMKTLLLIVAIFVVWYVLQGYILPRFGVKT
jgi:hypothetical protein